MNINESLIKKLKALREDVEDIDKDYRLDNIDDSDIDDFVDIEAPDFGESEIVSGNMFDTDNDSYEWEKPYSDIVEANGNQYQVWSAINFDYDETEYFVVSLEDSFIEFGPTDDLEEARNYLFDLKDDSDIEEQLTESGKVNCGNYSLVQNKDKSYSVIKESKEYKFNNKEKAKDYFKESIKAVTKTLKESVDSCINKSINSTKVAESIGEKDTLNEDLIVMTPQDFDQNISQVVPVSVCQGQECNDLGIVVDSAARVMEAYQNANKWLDIIKEFVYSDLSCVFFSSFIHELAHTMPERFDKFGDILHTLNIKIPYPATQYIPQEPQNINDVFNLTFMILDAIKATLNDFIKCTDNNFHGAACAAEALLNDIESEYPMWYRLKNEWEQCGEDNIKFDKYVNQYVKNKDDLLESLGENQQEIN